MSDSFTDAYRPDNQPKGIGWWPKEEQLKYCEALYDKGARDDWLINRLRYIGSRKA